MPHVFAQLLDNEYAERHQVLNEPVFRSPRPLHAFSVVTHIPLVNLSVEDERFALVSAYLKYWLTSNKAYIPPAPDQIDLTDDQNDEGIALPKLLSVSNCKDSVIAKINRRRPQPISRPDLLRVDGACAKLDRIFNDVVVHQPEYLIFGCYSQIIQIIHNLFSDDIGSDFAAISDVCEELVSSLHELLEEKSRLVRHALAPLIERASVPTRVSSHLHLGGLISEFRKLNTHYTPPSPWAKVSELKTFDADHCQFDLLPPAPFPLNPKFALRWYRSNQFWNYTFFESCTDVPPDSRMSSGPSNTSQLSENLYPIDTPSLSLGQQHDNMLDHHSTWLPSFVNLILHQGIAPSVLDATTLHKLFENVERVHFPGRTISGAHYSFLPVGVLVLILYFPAAARNMAANTANPRANIDKDALDKVVERLTSFARTSAYAEFIEILEALQIKYPEHMDALTVTAFRQALNNPNTLSLPPVRKLLPLGWLLWRFIATQSEERQNLGQIISQFCTDLWSAINAPTPRAFARQGDYISCYIVDRRALYFTNFQPGGIDRFTRTFFVDFALTGFQRGRLAERLCDIATYRTMSIRDINRIRAMVRGMDEISQELNVLEGKPPIDTTQELNKVLPQLNLMIASLGDIQQRLDEMNLFVTYGVRGRFLSVSGFYEQIRERCADIRQKRVFGFPMLSDFLDRRVAHGVRDVERMAERYDYLRGKVQDYYERVRTQYTQVETSRIAQFGETSNFMIDQMITLNQQTRIAQRATEVISVLLATSALVVWIKGLPVLQEYVTSVENWIAVIAILLLTAMALYLILRTINEIRQSRLYLRTKSWIEQKRWWPTKWRWRRRRG